MMVVAAAAAFGAAVIVAAAGGCSSKNLCPFPGTTAVTITPSTSCLTATVESCINPTLVATNGCDRALYMPVQYGLFDSDVKGADIEVLPQQTVHFVVRPEKAVAQTSSRKDFVIPARLTTQTVQFQFSTLAE